MFAQRERKSGNGRLGLAPCRANSKPSLRTRSRPKRRRIVGGIRARFRTSFERHRRSAESRAQIAERLEMNIDGYIANFERLLAQALRHPTMTCPIPRIQDNKLRTSLSS